METVFDINQIGLIVPALFVSVFAVLVFVFGFKKTNPVPDIINKDLLTETYKRKKDKVSLTRLFGKGEGGGDSGDWQPTCTGAHIITLPSNTVLLHLSSHLICLVVECHTKW